jgi:hypothetical protein
VKASKATRRWLAALGAMVASAILSLAIPLQAWAALSASVADFTMPALPYSHAQQTTAGTLQLTATDTGSCILFICSNNGWHVTIQASDFAYSGPNLGTAIPAANFSITQAHPPTRVSGQAISAQGGPRVPASNSTGTLNTPRETLEADNNFGLGSYRQLIDVSLIVPGQSRAGTYRTTLTVTISAGP